MAEEAIKPEDQEPILSAEEQAIHDRARSQGWRPKEEYNGPAERWVDAAEFLARGERELPILRERVRTMSDRVVHVERQLTEANTRIKEQSEVLVEVRDMARTAQKRGFDQAMVELNQRERRAVAEANTEEYDRVQAEKRSLGPAPAEPKPQPQAQPAPPPNGATPNSAEDTAIIEHWISENSWFKDDPEMNAVATSIHGTIRQREPSLNLTANLAKVRERIVTLYPDKFDNPQRRRAAPVLQSGAPAPKSRTKTVNDLPPEAKEALARFKRTLKNYKDEEYLKMYFGDDYDQPGASQ